MFFTGTAILWLCVTIFKQFLLNMYCNFQISKTCSFSFQHNGSNSNLISTFRAASCKKSIRKNNSIRKNKSTRKHILDLKMCFLVDLFFLIELFFLIDFYMKRLGMGRACFFWIGSSPSPYFLDRVEPGLQILHLEPILSQKNSVRAYFEPQKYQ